MTELSSKLLQIAAAGSARLPDWLKALAYKIPGVSEGIRRALTQAAPEEPVLVEVAGGIARGVRLRLDLKTQKYYWLGTHEMPLQRALQREIRPGMIVYDIGAHIGFFTLGLAQLVGTGGRVVAFEPHPNSAHRLRENVSLNEGLAATVQVVEAAVSEESGRVFLYLPAGSSKARLLSPSPEFTDRVEVASLTLDQWTFGQGEAPPDLIKLDVEGAEALALVGAPRLLQQVRPIWALELHGREAAQKAWGILQAAGYQVVSLDRQKQFQAPEQSAPRHVLALPR